MTAGSFSVVAPNTNKKIFISFLPKGESKALNSYNTIQIHIYFIQEKIKERQKSRPLLLDIKSLPSSVKVTVETSEIVTLEGAINAYYRFRFFIIFTDCEKHLTIPHSFCSELILRTNRYFTI